MTLAAIAAVLLLVCAAAGEVIRANVTGQPRGAQRRAAERAARSQVNTANGEDDHVRPGQWGDQ